MLLFVIVNNMDFQYVVLEDQSRQRSDLLINLGITHSISHCTVKINVAIAYVLLNLHLKAKTCIVLHNL